MTLEPATKIFWIIETFKHEHPSCVLETESKLIELIAHRTFGGQICGVYECEVGGCCTDRTNDILDAAERSLRDEAA